MLTFEKVGLSIYKRVYSIIIEHNSVKSQINLHHCFKFWDSEILCLKKMNVKSESLEISPIQCNKNLIFAQSCSRGCFLCFNILLLFYI